MCKELASAVEKLREEFGEVMVRVIETATVRIGSDQIEWEYRASGAQVRYPGDIE